LRRAAGVALAGLLLVAGSARAEPWSLLIGRVLERGSSSPIANARVEAGGASALTDGDGRFQLALPPGAVEVLVVEERHEPLRAVEKLRAGQGTLVEYRLLPRAARRYATVVRAAAPTGAGERFSLQGDELAHLPGGLGDPLHAVASMPGVAQPIPLLPVFVVRGSSPGASGFFLDGLRVPELFHSLMGGGMVHPRLLDRIDFHPGAYGVEFGRYVGGVVDAETRPARGDGSHGEAEVRPYEVSALGEARLGAEGRVAIAGHYGFPTPILQLFDPRVDVQYWDYQLRVDWRGLTIEALGASDAVSIATDQTVAAAPGTTGTRPYALSFHRIQVRERASLGRGVDFEAALWGGLDDMSDAAGESVEKLALGIRANVRARFRWLRLRAGLDAELSQVSGQNLGGASDPSLSPGGSAGPDELGDLAGDRWGIVAGGYVEADAELGRFGATAGVRGDVYHAGGVTVLAADPRLGLRARLLPALEVRAGIGLHQQPPTFPIALPGVDTFALRIGLQRAVQSAVTVEARLGSAVTASATGYYNRYWDLNDLLINGEGALCPTPPPEALTGLEAEAVRQVDGSAYGMELLLRRSNSNGERFSGWIAYTLGRASRQFSCGLRPADFDQTHVLNVVAQVRLPRNVMAGARLQVATGRPMTVAVLPYVADTQRNNARLPTYVQLDVRLDREWIFERWALAAFVEVLNLTYSETVFGPSYPLEGSVIRYDKPDLVGFRWVLPSLGLRGRF